MINIKTRQESGWKNYLIKADQFLETARDAYFKENWNAVGLNAVHSAISANDALTSYYGKIRSISEKHSDSISLLLEVFKNDEESKSYSKHILWLIGRKNLVEYESRLFFKKEAEESLKHAGRFLSWTKSRLPK
ncbi:MAG: HEPN domain-containing protein [Candidatus Falkowbacteria bacterium]